MIYIDSHYIDDLSISIVGNYVSSFLVSVSLILILKNTNNNFKVKEIKEIIIEIYLRLIEAEHFANDDVDTVLSSKI